MNKIIKKEQKIFFSIILLFCMSSLLTSCGKSYNKITIESKNSEVLISDDNVTSGDVIKPEDVVLTNTIPYLNKNRISSSPSLLQSDNVTNVLVLPIHFKGFYNALLEDEVKENINLTFNGGEKQVNPKSVKDYYFTSSNGKVNFNFDIADWSISDKEYYFYNNADSTYELISSVINQATINNKKIDLTKYDSNKDGYIDAVWAIYDMPNYQNSPISISENFWAYTLGVDNVTPNVKKPALNLFSFASFDFMNGYKNALNASTYIHETGHLFGLNDYYDYANYYSPLGGFDMMDLNIGDHNSYSKMLLEWTTPYIVYGNAAINAQELKNNKSCVVVLPDKKELVKNNDGKYFFNPSSEYFLIDLLDISSESNNYFDVSNGNESYNLNPNFISKDGYKIYYVDGRKLCAEIKKNKVNNPILYDSNVPLENNYQTLSLISNTVSGNKSESEVLKQIGLDSLYEDKMNYFNEITLISKGKHNQNSYDKLYFEFKDGKKIRIPISDNFYFHQGDYLNPDDSLSLYFVNGKNTDGIELNSKNLYSTSIKFE